MLTISTKDLPENATMAHVAAKSGAFSSVTQARKNGWDKPITLGVHRITKKVIINLVDREINSSDIVPTDRSHRPDLEPGFWPNYQEPTSHLARAIQFPMDAKFADRVVNAYMQDAREKRSKAVDKPSSP